MYRRRQRRVLPRLRHPRHGRRGTRALASLAAPDNDPALTGAIAQAVAERRSLRTELRCRTADGRGFWLGLHLMPSVDDGSETCQFVLLGRDITEGRNAGAEQKAIQQLLARVFLCVDAASADQHTRWPHPDEQHAVRAADRLSRRRPGGPPHQRPDRARRLRCHHAPAQPRLRGRRGLSPGHRGIAPRRLAGRPAYLLGPGARRGGGTVPHRHRARTRRRPVRGPVPGSPA